MSFTITHDHIDGGPGDEGDRPAFTIHAMPLYGVERALGEDDKLPGATKALPFKLYDDDGELYFEGVLDDDDECVNQTAALRWGESDAGCTTIKVKRDGEWVQEIG